MPPLRRALELIQKIHGEGHVGTANALNNLAQALRRSGNAAEAVALQEQVVALRRSEQPIQPGSMAGALCNSAVALNVAKDFKLALTRSDEGIGLYAERGAVDTFLALRCKLQRITALGALGERPQALSELTALMPQILVKNDAPQIESARALLASLQAN